VGSQRRNRDAPNHTNLSINSNAPAIKQRCQASD
jgi:hypothetical protein